MFTKFQLKALVGASFCALALPLCASAEEDSGNKQYYSSERRSPSQSCPALNINNRFSKENIAELNVFGGAFTGNLSGNTWAAGARGFFLLDSVFSIGAEYMYSTLNIDNGSGFGQIKTTNSQQIVDGQVAFNFPAMVKLGDVNMPLTIFATVGAGAIDINDSWKWLLVVGGGAKMYLQPEWLALRLDINSYLHNTPTITGNKFGADFAVTAGLSFFFPYRPA